MTNGDVIRILREYKSGGGDGQTHFGPHSFDLTDETVEHIITALERYRWISVKYADESSLPEKEKCVIVCAFGTTVGEGWYYGFDGIHHVWKLAVSSGTYWDDEVVAWMPLPEPPKEDKP